MGNQVGTRSAAIEAALGAFDSGKFLDDLNRRVAFRTESQEPSKARHLHDYLTNEIVPALARLGFKSRIVSNPAGVDAPVLLAERHEGEGLPTVVTYGHGDVVRGYDNQWNEGLKPWEIVVDGDRWYGRGIADNKGQHSVNIEALEAVISQRGGRLGYNVKVIFETGEEIGSPGLDEICAAEKDFLKGDLFLASDGPRVSAERPTIFLGSRGELDFELKVNLRESGHHSGNWGGILRNPAVVLSHAISTLLDKDGAILVDGLLPPPVGANVREALSDIQLGTDPSAPAIDPTWGQPGLTAAEKVLAWNAIEVLAFKAGTPDSPVNAVPPSAIAYCQLRYVVGTDVKNAQEYLEKHFAKHGFSEYLEVTVKPPVEATRLDLDDPWIDWTLKSIQQSTGKKPALIPNLGGTVPNAVFAETLGLPTVWVPHSYPACSQHAPNEHFLGSVGREALALMAGIWWDLGDTGAEIVAARKQSS